MFKDDYKFANEKITASSDLKKRTLEIINAPKESKVTPFMRYGLICASFLFVVAIFPVLYGLEGLTNDKSAPLMVNDQVGEMMPQTGVEESSIAASSQRGQESAKLDEKPKELLGLSNPLSGESNPLSGESNPLGDQSKSEEKSAQQPQTEEQVQAKKFVEEINKVESAIESKIKMFAMAIPVDKINFNELTAPAVKSKPKNFKAEEGYYEEQWTNKQILEYLGVSPTPSYIPSNLKTDLAETDSATQKVVFNKDGTIAYDTFQYSFLEPQSTKEINPARRTLSISAAKDKLPIDCVIYIKDDAATSIIEGCELKLGMLKQAYEYNDKKEPTAYYDKYVAEFILNGVGYQIITDNLTQKEFTDVISSIIIPIPN